MNRAEGPRRQVRYVSATARTRRPWLVGFWFSLIGLAVVLTIADLGRGRDSRLRAFFDELTPSDASRGFVDQFRQNPRGFRPK